MPLYQVADTPFHIQGDELSFLFRFIDRLNHRAKSVFKHYDLQMFGLKLNKYE